MAPSRNFIFSLKFELRLHSWAMAKLSLGSQAADLLKEEGEEGGKVLFRWDCAMQPLKVLLLSWR